MYNYDSVEVLFHIYRANAAQFSILLSRIFISSSPSESRHVVPFAVDFCNILDNCMKFTLTM